MALALGIMVCLVVRAVVAVQIVVQRVQLLQQVKVTLARQVAPALRLFTVLAEVVLAAREL
jgi:hypothetical protein